MHLHFIAGSTAGPVGQSNIFNTETKLSKMTCLQLLSFSKYSGTLTQSIEDRRVLRIKNRNTKKWFSNIRSLYLLSQTRRRSLSETEQESYGTFLIKLLESKASLQLISISQRNFILIATRLLFFALDQILFLAKYYSTNLRVSSISIEAKSRATSIQS